MWQVSYISYKGFAYILYNEKLETLCLLELDSFLSVKEGSLHSIAQDYCNISMETGQHYFCSLYLWQNSTGTLVTFFTKLCVAQNIINGHFH